MSETDRLEEESFGPVRVLYGAERGKYPQGNSILVEGTRETVLIDPSLAVHPRKDALPPIDRILLSHCHEDHLAGCALFSDAALQVHAEILRANPDRKLVVAGHCDQRGTREYNLALGERRAKAISAILQANGVSSRQIEDISYGEEELANPANNARAWAQNRRAVISYR